MIHDTAALDRLIERLIVEELADLVVGKLRALSKTALVLFTGTSIGLGHALRTLGTLQRDGWTLRLVATPCGQKVVPRDAWSLGAWTEGPAAVGPDDGAEPGLDRLLDGCGLVLVPTLSISAAAKVAGCIRDDLASRLLPRALERGLTIVAATNGCCPEDPDRLAGGFAVTDAYKARLSANLTALQDYGVRLVRAAKLADAAKAATVGHASRAVTPAPVRWTETAPTEGRANGERRVFGRGQALQVPEGDLHLGRDVLVTPLARDELRKRNIRLIEA